MAEPTRPTAGVHGSRVAQAEALPQGTAATHETEAPSGDAARPSLLSRGAPPPGSPPFEPWFKDDDKLLAAVIARASADRDFAARVASAVGALAHQHPGLRKRLNMEAAGGRRGAPSSPEGLLMMVAETLRVARSQRRTRASVADWIVDSARILGVPKITTTKGAQKLIDRAVKAARAHPPD